MIYTEEQVSEAMEGKPTLWVIKHKIKNEVGFPIEFKKRKFLYDMYNDLSPNQVELKPPQIGATVKNTIKSFYVAAKKRRQIIYTLPTASDIQDMVGGSINRIIAQNPVLMDLVKDHDTVEQKKVGEAMIFYRGCVDEETEVLTENGWMKLGFVNVGDKVPTLNMITNTVEMDNVLDMSVFRVQKGEKMVRIKSRQVDQLVTADHRCVISKRTFAGNKSPLRIARAHELVGKTSAYIPMRHIGISMPYGNAGDLTFYRILGWVIGDGSYWTKRDKYTSKKEGNKIAISKKVCIIQSKFCDELEADLRSANMGFYKKRHNGMCWRYELNAKASLAIRDALPDKELTYSLIFNATPFERKALYEGLMLSDGNNYKDTHFYQNKGQTVDAFQALMVLLGKTTSYGSNRKNVQVSIKTTDYAQVNASYEDYEGIAWCPTTKNGTIFIRRNGIVSVTGQTFTAKQAMMIPSGLNIHDEVDSSDSDVITQYETRLQAQEDGGWRWYFSHPSLSGHGVDVYWQRSDKKEFYIMCDNKHEEFMEWPMSVDISKETYICKVCQVTLSDEQRINGRWINKDGIPWNEKIEGGYEFSGWHSSQLMLWNKTATDIIKASNDPQKDKQYFYNYVLGLPYIGSEDKIEPAVVLRNCVDIVNPQKERVIIGADTSHGINYVLMNNDGVFFYERAEEITASKDPYDVIRGHLERYKRSVAVFDQGGDLIGVRKLQAEYPGRVYLCFYQRDKKSNEIVRWGDGDEYGTVKVDRNRHITLLVEQLRETGRIILNGTKEEWTDFANQFDNIYREKITVKEAKDRDDRSLYGGEYVWKRNGHDDYVHALGYAVIGMMRFGGGKGGIIRSPEDKTAFEQMKESPTIAPDKTIPAPDPKKVFIMEDTKYGDE